MLEQNIIEQLKSVFSKLENKVSIHFDNSSHAKQSELEEMLNEISSTSDKIEVVSTNTQASYPRFYLSYAGLPNGISFVGIPGGHEFSSLVLAILNSDQKGKFPDPMILKRIRSLKGPIKLRTFISLSCENCPEVVQALNLMAIVNRDFQHEMVDGEFVSEEIERLKIQGVPSVVSSAGKLLSSGKVSLVDLLERIEKEFGISQTSQEIVDLGNYDVVVVGAGPAGASAAIYSARKGLKTALITDRMGGQLQDTKGIENLISVPYTEGPELANNLNKHIKDYSIEVLEHRRVLSIEKGNLKKLTLNSHETIKTKSLIVATGAKWRELGVEGEKEYLGRGVAFCPHCDGPYYKGKDIAVVGGGNSGVEAAIDLAGIVKSVTLVEFAPELKADKVLVNKLESLPNINIIKNARSNRVLGNGEKVIALEYENRASGQLIEIPLDGIFVQIGLIPNSLFVKDLVETNKFGEIIVDHKCKTSEAGVYAAGDVTNVPYKQIVVAMGEGAKAALSSFEDMMMH